MLIIPRPSADGGRVSIGAWSFHFCAHRYFLSDSGGVVYATAFFITSTALGSILLMNISKQILILGLFEDDPFDQSVEFQRIEGGANRRPELSALSKDE